MIAKLKSSSQGVQLKKTYKLKRLLRILKS